MKTNWTEQPYFAALDWAKDHHDVIVVDRLGAIVADFRFAHTADGWRDFEQRMQPFGKCPLAIETSSGLAVDQLVQRAYPLYPVNPKAAKRYRERKVPSGTKTDRYDAWSLADALRTDGQAWRALRAQDEATSTLRLLCGDEIGLIEQRTALVNQLQAALADYYPLALESFEDWTQPFAWAWVKQFPTPSALQAAGKRQWEKFLHGHKLWRPQTAPQRLASWAQGQALNASPAVLTAKSLLAQSLVRVLETLQHQIEEYRRRITEAFAAHPDHDIFGSLPGAKQTLGPRLLSGLGSARERFPDTQSRCAKPGSAPSVMSRVRSAKPMSAGRVISFCATPFICGPTRAAKSAPGRRLITKPNVRRATATPAPCVAWANAGSSCSGGFGRTVSATMNKSISTAWNATAPSSGRNFKPSIQSKPW